MTDTSARLLRLLSLFQTRREWSGTELAARLEVSPRTVRRDVERLRDLGYPVHATLGSLGGYRLEAGTAMPPLLLDDEEAVAIAIGLHNAAGGAVEGIDESSARALAKIEQVLPERLRRRVSALHAATASLTGPPAGPAVAPGTLAMIATAARDRERLRFGYLDKDGAETRRLVEPHGLVAAGRRWYLVAWDAGREGWRTFRADRIGSPHLTGVRFAPRDLPARDLPAYVAQSFAASRPSYRAVLTVHASAEEVAGRIRVTEGELAPVDARTCTMRTTVDSLDYLALRIAFLGWDFDVHEPRELADHLRDLGRRLVRAAGA